MTNKKFLLIMALLVGSLAAAGWYVLRSGARPPAKLGADPVTSEPVRPPLLTPAEDAVADSLEEVDDEADGVNTEFTDPPRIQKAWILRGQEIVLKNRPDADHAEFRHSFFHRGFKYRPVTCGEVRFLAADTIIEDYQRFIYVGIQSSHLENEVTNFDLLWSKLCVQTFE